MNNTCRGKLLSEHLHAVYRFFFCPKSASSSSPLKRIRSDLTSSRSIVISLSSAFAFASAIRLSSSISSIRFLRSVSNALIRSVVLFKLLKTISSNSLDSVAAALKICAIQLSRYNCKLAFGQMSAVFICGTRK